MDLFTLPTALVLEIQCKPLKSADSESIAKNPQQEAESLSLIKHKISPQRQFSNI
jgi:hypothetical protein